MLQIEWRDEYCIDGGTIDQEHKSLLEMANRVFAMMDPRAELEEVIDLVKSLFRYVHTHFEHEESLMMEANYPGVVEHMQKHRRISQRLTEAIRGNNDIDKIGQYLQHIMLDWVIRHILSEDVKFGRFLEQAADSPLAASTSR